MGHPICGDMVEDGGIPVRRDELLTIGTPIVLYGRYKANQPANTFWSTDEISPLYLRSCFAQFPRR
jgi:hypothetical protein